nr:hypothetical protein [Tanacetum cinerariifolium]
MGCGEVIDEILTIKLCVAGIDDEDVPLQEAYNLSRYDQQQYDQYYQQYYQQQQQPGDDDEVCLSTVKGSTLDSRSLSDLPLQTRYAIVVFVLISHKTCMDRWLVENLRITLKYERKLYYIDSPLLEPHIATATSEHVAPYQALLAQQDKVVLLMLACMMLELYEEMENQNS